MRRGRQEDSHEFLRYAIDALQKACLAGHSSLVFPFVGLNTLCDDLLPHSKADPKIAETTWVHKIFGGKLRSRVTCNECHHNSDTFDSILDLSVDIHGVETLRDALRKFTAIDYLKGADKYKCEKYVILNIYWHTI
jgi:ubiquitin carboxyl-terminal hydrolase 36/42